METATQESIEQKIREFEERWNKLLARMEQMREEQEERDREYFRQNRSAFVLWARDRRISMSA